MKHPSSISNKDVNYIEKMFNPLKEATDLEGNIIIAPKKTKPRKPKIPKNPLFPSEKNTNSDDFSKVKTLKDLMKFEPDDGGVECTQDFWSLWRKHKDVIKVYFKIQKIDDTLWLLFRKAKKLKQMKPDTTMKTFFK